MPEIPDFWNLLLSMGVPSAITGLIVWRAQKKMEQREQKKAEAEAKVKEQERQREQAQEGLMLMLIECTGAAIALGEATARAVQRIPDAHCNGDMHEALDYAAQVKRKMDDFLAHQGVSSVIK